MKMIASNQSLRLTSYGSCTLSLGLICTVTEWNSKNIRGEQPKTPRQKIKAIPNAMEKALLPDVFDVLTELNKYIFMMTGSLHPCFRLVLKCHHLITVPLKECSLQLLQHHLRKGMKSHTSYQLLYCFLGVSLYICDQPTNNDGSAPQVNRNQSVI